MFDVTACYEDGHHYSYMSVRTDGKFKVFACQLPCYTISGSNENRMLVNQRVFVLGKIFSR